MHIRQEALDRSVEALRRSQAEAGVSLTDTMEALTDSVTSIFGLTGAGLMLVDDDQLLHSVLATDDLGWVLEDKQAEVGEGPCVDTVVHGCIFATEDVTADDRWPRLAEAVAGSGLGAVLGVPIRLAGATVGALNVYVDGHHEWDESDRHALTTFAQVLETTLSVALLAEQRDTLVKQLQQALDSRVIIERCVGLLMGQKGLSASDAYNHLRDIARPSRRKVHDIAREMLAENG